MQSGSAGQQEHRAQEARPAAKCGADFDMFGSPF